MTHTRSLTYDPIQVEKMWSLLMEEELLDFVRGDEGTSEESRAMTVYEAMGDSLIELFHPLQDDDVGYEVEDYMTPTSDRTPSAAQGRRKVLVGGSRGWTNHDAIYMKLAELDPLSWEVLHGGAEGADSAVMYAALDLGLTAFTYSPDYKKHGKAAPHVRNDLMLDKADRVIVFWDGKSRGTKSVIEKARKRGLEVEVVYAAA